MLLLKWQLTCKALILCELTLNLHNNIGSGTSSHTHNATVPEHPAPAKCPTSSQTGVPSCTPDTSQWWQSCSWAPVSVIGCLSLAEKVPHVDHLFNFHFLKFPSVLRVPNTTSRFSNSLDLLTAHSIESYSWLGSTTVKGYSPISKTARAKVHRVKS